jgi:ribosome biogenesis protein BRX1
MGKKRKHSETVVAPPKKDMSAAERPTRTLLGWKDKSEEVNKESVSTVFRNKEKVLVTCSRRINYRLKILFPCISLS